MTLFPFYEDIEDKRFLIVGGGRVAKEKLGKVRMFTDRILVVAEETDITEVTVRQRAFRDEDLKDCDVCIVATSDRSVNAHIAALCREQHIPVNVVDDRKLCSFVFPSFVKRGDLTVSITTSGKSPAYARTLRKQLEEIIPDNIGEILERMDSIRAAVPERIPDQRDRSALYKMILAKLLECDNQVTDEEIEAMICQAEKEQ